MSVKEPLTSYLQWGDVPQLSDPVMLAGFHGWSDAGGVSSDTLEFLIEALKPSIFATLTNEPFLNYALDRPTGHIDGGLILHLEPMLTKFGHWSNSEGPHDLIIVLGREPHFNWHLYTRILLSVMVRLGAKRLYTVGGVQDAVSHSEAPLVSIVGSSASAIARTLAIEKEIQLSSYYGPVSIHSCLLKMCMDSGIEGVSLWGHVPAYLQKNPRMTAKLVSIIADAVEFECSVEALIRRSIEMERRINEILAKDPNLKQFVESIEGRKSPSKPSSGDDKIIRLNDFLRRDTHKDPPS
jgi:proteasome assembly chaperone (PAC2) family protein